ncbi:N-acetyltransferase [Mycolicibacterium novocastrense]|uniref:N-acetyltransferase n=1 Tax=Mycolicibacterium novocastrense TaxID=59813 RepID=A0AAW5SSN1_MYCNV|nr:GNAT family N-acetyltransferase [Mycolicibacterium novocastrense]MCV7026748.1 N-acetyltransferase [Mycolicibacterium novocastrense]GAT10565.1 sortase-like acyltransferase [Mycolicibacterium novocastrense]
MAPSGILVRAAHRGDLGAIADIYAHYVENSVATFELVRPDREEWGRRYGAVVEAGLPFLSAVLHGEIVGYAYCAPWKTRPAYRHTVEDSVYVAPGALGRGVGGMLLDALLTGCATAGIREVIAVIVDADMAASAALHRRRGFVEVGRLTAVGFKHGRWLDTLLLQRSLVA